VIGNCAIRQSACQFLLTFYSNKSSGVAEMGERLATIDMTRKVGAAALLSVGGTGSPSNTMSPGPRPTTVPSDILIHATVWSQYTNVIDRQNRQENDPAAYGRPLLVTVTVAKKTAINECRLQPTPKPEVEIWRKPHKRTLSARLPSLLHAAQWARAPKYLGHGAHAEYEPPIFGKDYIPKVH